MMTEGGNRYLPDRGIPLDYAAQLGVDETLPLAEIVRTRLRWKSDDSQIASAFANVASLLWFPLPDGNSEVFYNARVNGSYFNQEGKLQRFLFTKGGRNTVWIPSPTREVAPDPSVPLIVIEGPFINQETHEPEAFDIWCARTLAFIGDIDDQLKDRAIAIRLARKPETEVKPRLGETPYEYTEKLRRKILRWTRDNAESIGAALVPALKSGNDRAADNWEMLFRIAAVIDPDNVESVVQIALSKEIEGGDRESEEDAVLQGVREAFREACQAIGKIYDLPATDIFLSLSTICDLLNLEEPKMGPWHTWKRGEKWGANEYRLSKIVRTYSPGDADRSREEPNLSGLIATWKLTSSDVRGFWLRLRPVFERYQ